MLAFTGLRELLEFLYVTAHRRFRSTLARTTATHTAYQE
jgi:hypothetical protein